MIYLYVYLFIGLIFSVALGWEYSEARDRTAPRGAGDWFGYVSALLMCAVLWPMFMFLMWEPRR